MTLPLPPKEECVHCKQEIPAGAVQQGQSFHGQWYPLHVGCADEYLASEITLVQIFNDDEPYVDFPCAVEIEFAEMEVGEEFTAKKLKMTRLQWLQMPER